MRILTHPMHTGYDYELAKTGHEFHVVGPWDYGQRPKPGNWNLIASPSGDYDAGILCTPEAFKWMSRLNIPLIYVVHADSTQGEFPSEIEERVDAIVFSSIDVANRVVVRSPSKKKVIEHSIDIDIYKGFRGDGGNVLCVGNVMKRPEKGLSVLLEINSVVQVDLLGDGNQGIPCAIGNAANYEGLLERYRQYKVFLNPSRIVSTSLLEAMGMGMPVVSFKSINFCDLIENGTNGFVVDTVAEAIHRIKNYLDNEALRGRLGASARQVIGKRFDPKRFQSRWNSTVDDVVGRFEKRTEVTGVRWVSSFLDGSGYAEAARNYVAALSTVGVHVVAKLVTYEVARSDYGRAGKFSDEALSRSGPCDINIVFLTPDNFLRYRDPNCYNVGLFDWETDTLPPGWVDACNQMDEIWVPCQWSSDTCKKSGVVRPIYVFGHCGSPEDYVDGPLLTFPEIDPSWYKFYSIFQWTERKNPRGLIEAYLTAFTEKDPVVLILKTYRGDYSKGEQQGIVDEIEKIKKAIGKKNQPRMMVLLDMMTKSEMQALHRTGDCFVLLHRAEGWGLPHFEACMMGKPVITTGYSANLEFTTPEHSYLVGHKMIPLRGMDWIPWYSKEMTWAEPNIMQCRSYMRYVFQHQEEADKKGKIARSFVNKKFTWTVIGRKMKVRLKEIMVGMGVAGV